MENVAKCDLMDANVLLSEGSKNSKEKSVDAFILASLFLLLILSITLRNWAPVSDVDIRT